MDKYEILKQIGDGTYGTVAKAIHKPTGQLVAVKRMKQKYYSWEECLKLAEVQVLRKLHAHPNVIKLREVLREKNELYFVFEFMDGDVLGVIRAAKQSPPMNPNAPMVPHAKVRSYMYQILQSLVHVHKSGYFHRDMKPENLLIRKDTVPGGAYDVVKLADFGLVKEIRARPPFTDYVSTRWYRSPELLLQDRAYTSSVDLWACGCIMAELITTRPLFPGSNELDQLFRIICVLGAPTEKQWPEGIAMAKKLKYTFPTPAVTPLRKLLPSHIPPQAFDLIEKLLEYNPKKRLTAAQALQHPYFTLGDIGLDGPFSMPTAAMNATIGGSENKQQPLQYNNGVGAAAAAAAIPLDLAGRTRPQHTSSAPPSQLQNTTFSGTTTHGTGGTGGSPYLPNNTSNNNTLTTKPGSADRPLMPPVYISRPTQQQQQQQSQHYSPPPPLHNNNNTASNNNQAMLAAAASEALLYQQGNTTTHSNPTHNNSNNNSSSVPAYRRASQTLLGSTTTTGTGTMGGTIGTQPPPLPVRPPTHITAPTAGSVAGTATTTASGSNVTAAAGGGMDLSAACGSGARGARSSLLRSTSPLPHHATSNTTTTTTTTSGNNNSNNNNSENLSKLKSISDDLDTLLEEFTRTCGGTITSTNNNNNNNNNQSSSGNVLTPVRQPHHTATGSHGSPASASAVAAHTGLSPMPDLTKYGNGGASSSSSLLSPPPPMGSNTSGGGSGLLPAVSYAAQQHQQGSGAGGVYGRRGVVPIAGAGGAGGNHHHHQYGYGSSTASIVVGGGGGGSQRDRSPPAAPSMTSTRDQLSPLQKLIYGSRYNNNNNTNTNPVSGGAGVIAGRRQQPQPLSPPTVGGGGGSSSGLQSPPQPLQGGRSTYALSPSLREVMRASISKP